MWWVWGAVPLFLGARPLLWDMHPVRACLFLWAALGFSASLSSVARAGRLDAAVSDGVPCRFYWLSLAAVGLCRLSGQAAFVWTVTIQKTS